MHHPDQHCDLPKVASLVIEQDETAIDIEIPGKLRLAFFSFTDCCGKLLLDTSIQGYILHLDTVTKLCCYASSGFEVIAFRIYRGVRCTVLETPPIKESESWKTEYLDRVFVGSQVLQG